MHQPSQGVLSVLAGVIGQCLSILYVLVVFTELRVI